MCGIAGYFGEIAPQYGSRLLQSMNDCLAHRGPDGEGTWAGEQVGLAQRRLAIIDLEGGAQPMASMDGRYQIVCNGEIYNHDALRSELRNAGYEFKSRSDTEVIPAAVDRWGVESALLKLRGMFAFALYDSQQRRLLLARDPVGIKPLYLARTRDSILFASEPKAILATGLTSRRWDPVAVLDFFTVGQALSPHTCWSAIRELDPGTWMYLTPTGEQRGCYWSWKPQGGKNWSEAEAIDRLEAVLVDSLHAHLESDVPVAAFLSGGVDSSLLVSLLCQRLEVKINSFNVGFEERSYDESPYARAVAAHCGSRHSEIRVAGEGSNPELLKRIVEQYDQPFGDSSCIPTWLICREIARHNKVVISGDGGDEMFGGYQRYQTARDLAALKRIPLAQHAVAAVGAILPGTSHSGRVLRKASAFADLPRNQMLCALRTYFDARDLASLLVPEVASAMMAEGPTYWRFPTQDSAASDAAEELMVAEIRSMLHADYLRKVDVASSAHGLEVRTPYLDLEVFALAANLPMALKVRRNSPKHVLRQLARRWLPPCATDRRKQGFGIPFDRWVGKSMRPFLYDLLLGSGSASKRYLRQSRVRRLLEAFFDACPIADLSRYQVYQRIFMLLSFELWLRKWVPELN